ncbi:MAG: transporter ATPase subunit [Clostridiales bacterium]|jgi:oligopeptide transport system ATP-binding protein|nr:transporter ATPase subunit [Clostridiales bacterium]
MDNKLLEIKDLYFSFDTYAGEVQAVRGVSLYVNSKETLALVGESGCGKSVTIQNVMKLIPSPPGRLKSGSIIFNGKDITNYKAKEMQKLRGKEMAMIFQDPMTCLDPTMKIGKLIIEGMLKHEKITRVEAEKRAISMLSKVGISNPDKSMNRYPHQLSGGMRQRVMIAMNLTCSPKILFADEPTTALDVTTQSQILELMNKLKDEMDTSIVLITHDLGVVARMAQRICVMYAGKIVETGSSNEIFYNPMHPYTWGLLSSMPGKNRIDKSKFLETIPGSPPDLFAPPIGCSFAARCSYCMGICKKEQPEKVSINGEHSAACWLLDQRAPNINRPVFKSQVGALD